MSHPSLSRRLRGIAALGCLAAVAACTSAAVASPPLGGGQSHLGEAPAVTGGAAAYIRTTFGPDVRVRWDSSGAYVKQLHGLSEGTAGADAKARAAGFLKAHPALFGPIADLEVTDLQTPRLRGPEGELTRTIVRMRQLEQGIPVEGRSVVVTLDGQGQVIAVQNDLRRLDFDPAPERLDALQAAALTEEAFAVSALPDNATLAWIPVGQSARRAWKVPAVAVALVAHFFVWIDAEDGAVLRTGTASPGQRHEAIPLRDAAGETP